MKKLKKLLSLTLILALAFSMPVQAAAKKVAVVAYEESKEDYPSVTTGTYRVTVGVEGGCMKFKAKKAGTYRFTLKDTEPLQVTFVNFWKNQIADINGSDKTIASQDYKDGQDSISANYKLKKGDTVYVSMDNIEFGMPTSGKVTFAIKKVK